MKLSFLVASMVLYSELNSFLSSQSKILFAYSGGLDSTAVLHLLNNECKKRNINLITFTINHGFKGKKILENISKVISFEKLNSSHYTLDISNMLLESGETVKEFYSNFCRRGIIPCGPNCNKIIESLYKKVLTDFGVSIVFTGGDTLAKNEKGEQTIFWKKKGYIVLRGAAAFGLTKEKSKELILKERIPWKNPCCGGYDTDCLIPGGVLRKLSGKMTIGEIHKKVPLIKEYLLIRRKSGVITEKQFEEEMSKIDVADNESYEEYNEAILPK